MTALIIAFAFTIGIVAWLATRVAKLEEQMTAARVILRDFHMLFKTALEEQANEEAAAREDQKE